MIPVTEVTGRPNFNFLSIVNSVPVFTRFTRDEGKISGRLSQLSV